MLLDGGTGTGDGLSLDVFIGSSVVGSFVVSSVEPSIVSSVASSVHSLALLLLMLLRESYISC